MRRAILVAALLGLSVAGCSTPPTSVFQVSSSTGDAEAAAQLISQYRVARGLSPVRADNRLNQAAEFQARAVAEVGELSHGAFASRMASFGVGGFSAENLSAGSRSVDQAVGRWKASPRHDENLLLPQATRIGLARADAPGSRYGRYWALVLAQ